MHADKEKHIDNMGCGKLPLGLPRGRKVSFSLIRSFPAKAGIQTNTAAKRHPIKGFTLIELVIVIVILGILTAVALPRYGSIADDALAAAQEANVASAKSAFAIYLGENGGTYPTVSELAAQMGGASVTPVSTGIQVTIQEVNYVVGTYTDSMCVTATSVVGDSVRCIGGVLP